MAGASQPPKCDKPSINYRCSPSDGASFELVDFGYEDHVSASSNKNKKSRIPGSESSQFFSTRELISGLGSIWNRASGPLSSLVSKSSCRCDGDGGLQKYNILFYPSGERACSASVVADNQKDTVTFISVGDSAPMFYANLRYLKVVDKISFVQPSSETNSLIRRLLHRSYRMPQELWKEKGYRSSSLECDLEKIYSWMTEIALPNLTCRSHFSAMKKQESNDCYAGYCWSDPTSCSLRVDKPTGTNVIVGNCDSQTDKTQLTDPLSVQNDDSAKSIKASAMLWIEDGPVQDVEACTSELPSPSFAEDSLGSFVHSDVCNTEESETSVESDPHENQKHQKQELVSDTKLEMEICLPMNEKSHSAVAKQGHAFAGAMAGVFVSFCLHPADTIKTVVQSGRADQKSLHDISRSIISQRGLTGLYRGISTNVASSAPISAVYTFTYEWVKGVLLPVLPEEYQSLAHCVGGGCASVATSFIFTPSERIKQQMQVGLRYQNCWNALVGIIEKGGLPSLYAGWGAVLCRNVPHSIIKFYAYESLKQFFTQFQLNGQTSTLVTLLSGGLAGSTAALFTTPFDVVKTRLQTQIPGSMNQCHGVFSILTEIAKNEGLKGLYRGLTPRLFMYMTQGALFFASYESFKRLFSLNNPQVNVQARRHERIKKDDPPVYLHQDEDCIICLLV